MPIGTPLEKTAEVVERYERICLDVPEIKSTFAMAGAVDRRRASRDPDEEAVVLAATDPACALAPDRASLLSIRDAAESTPPPLRYRGSPSTG